MPIDWEHVCSLSDPMDVAQYVLEHAEQADTERLDWLETQTCGASKDGKMINVTTLEWPVLFRENDGRLRTCTLREAIDAQRAGGRQACT